MQNVFRPPSCENGEVVSLHAGDVQDLPHAAQPSSAAALRPVRQVNRRRPVVCHEVPLHHLVRSDDTRVLPDGGILGQRPDSRPWCRATLRLQSAAGEPVGLGAGRSQLGRSLQGPVTLPRPRPSARSTGRGSAPWRHRRRGLGSSRGLHFRLGWRILPVPDRVIGLEIGAILALFVRSRQPGPLSAQISRPDRPHQAPGSRPAIFVRQGLEVVHRVTDHDRADALGRAGGYWHVLRFRPSAGVPGSVADRYREVAGPFGLRCFVTHVPLPVRRACRGVAVGQPRRTPLVVVAPSSGDQPAAVPGCCCRATGFLRCSDPAEIVPGNPGALHAGPRNALARCWARRTVTASRPSPAPTAATCPAGRSR